MHVAVQARVSEVATEHAICLMRLESVRMLLLPDTVSSDRFTEGYIQSQNVIGGNVAPSLVSNTLYRSGRRSLNRPQDPRCSAISSRSNSATTFNTSSYPVSRALTARH